MRLTTLNIILDEKLVIEPSEYYQVYLEYAEEDGGIKVSAINLQSFENPDVQGTRLDLVKNKKKLGGSRGECRNYKIVRSTDYEGNDNLKYSHRIGRIVATPVIDESMSASLRYLKESDGTDMEEGRWKLRTSYVKRVELSEKDEKVCLVIKTRNSIIYLEEV